MKQIPWTIKMFVLVLLIGILFFDYFALKQLDSLTSDVLLLFILALSLLILNTFAICLAIIAFIRQIQEITEEN